jgi:hypothetical protein
MGIYRCITGSFWSFLVIFASGGKYFAGMVLYTVNILANIAIIQFTHELVRNEILTIIAVLLLSLTYQTILFFLFLLPSAAGRS